MTTLACQHVDVALSLQRTIRERDADGGLDIVIGDACGEPSIGFVDDVEGSPRHFCARHRLEAPIVRD